MSTQILEQATRGQEVQGCPALAAVPDPQTIAAAVRTVTARYIAEGQASNVLEINCGLCEDFAQDVLKELGVEEGERCFIVGYDNLDLLDRRWMAKHWPGSKLPAGLTFKDLDRFGMDETTHVWLTVDGRHYDADCPDGVDSVFELLNFRRNLVCAALEEDPDFLEARKDDPWWAESIQLHMEFREWRGARAGAAGELNEDEAEADEEDLDDPAP